MASSGSPASNWPPAAIELPRIWDDPEREPDDDPADQLAAMFGRVRAALQAWTEVLDHIRQSPFVGEGFCRIEHESGGPHDVPSFRPSRWTTAGARANLTPREGR